MAVHRIVIAASDIEARMAGIEPIGLGPTGTNRLAWTDEDAEAARWFEAQAEDVGLRFERDPAGNLWACPPGPSPWWGVGSHLDSVRDGGRYDGALGVAAGFEIATRARVPVAVVSFADEEGARFNTPTFGSRALVGRLDVADVMTRTDDDGTALRDAMTAMDVDPSRLAEAPRGLARLAGFVELHIDQTRDVASAGAPFGIVSALAARVRLRVDLTGRADHSGTTRRGERRDALHAAARLILAADELAGSDPAFLVTATRMLVEPNALTTVAARVALWLDARAATPDDLQAWRSRLDATAQPLVHETGVAIAIATASESPGVAFDARVAGALAEAADPQAPEVVCYAGHDAGILAERVPAGMVLVRNETGVSHSAEESVNIEDAARAADAVLTTLEALA